MLTQFSITTRSMWTSISELPGFLYTYILWFDIGFILDANQRWGSLINLCSQLPKGLNQGLTDQGI